MEEWISSSAWWLTFFLKSNQLVSITRLQKKEKKRKEKVD
jgi:hypothetical protein